MSTIIKEPTTTETGLKILTCIVCGKEKEEQLPQKTTENTNSNQTTNTSSSEKPNNSTISSNETLLNNTSSTTSNQSITPSSSKQETSERPSESDIIENLRRENRNLKIFMGVVMGIILIIGVGIGIIVFHKSKIKNKFVE